MSLSLMLLFDHLVFRSLKSFGLAFIVESLVSIVYINVNLIVLLIFLNNYQAISNGVFFVLVIVILVLVLGFLLFKCVNGGIGGNVH